MTDLFGHGAAQAVAPTSMPLAETLRPQQLAQVSGQSHLLGPGKPLRRSRIRS